MMKKRLSSILLALCLCVTLLPKLALAEGNQKPWEESTGWIDLNDYYNKNGTSEPLATGNYYLTNDLKLHSGCFEVADDAEVTVDLNGHYFVVENVNATRFRVSNRGKFTLQDSTGGGYITGYDKGGVVSVEDNGSFTLKSGMIVYMGGTGAAVLCKTGGAFTMEGGTLYSLMNNAPTVQLENGGTFTLNGGSVKATSLSSGEDTDTTNAVILFYDANDEEHPEKPVMKANGGTVEGTVKSLGGTIQSDRKQKATVFTDAPCLAVNEDETGYVSTGKRDSSAVYNGGTISGGVFENAVINHCDWDDDIQSDGTITGGYFRGKLTCEGETISGGYFRYTADPNGHTKDGYYVNPSDIVGYTYVVDQTPTDPDAVYLFTAEMTSSKVSVAGLNDTERTELEALLENASVTGVGAALSTAEMVKVAANDGGIFGLDSDGKIIESGNIYIRIWVTVELTEYSDGALTFTATPKYDLNATSGGMAVGSNGTNGRYDLTNDQLNGKPITVRLPLPEGYTPNQITHTCKDGTEEIFINKAYRPNTSAKHFTIETIDGVRYAVFTITSFSTFELSETVTYVEPVTFDNSDPTYAISIQDAAHGSVALGVKRKYAWAGDTVTLLVDPDRGWTLETLTVTDSRGNTVDVTAKNGKYTFQMPAGKVTVTATFMEDNAMLSFFVDVPVESYYYDAVLWAAENGITGGVDDTHFGPYATCTRGQLAAFLYRYAQSQGKGFTGAWMFQLPFTDVPEWCYEAVAWCYMNDIVGGYGDGRFGPNDTVTRQQFVTILYRFAVAMGMDVSVGEDTNILSYNDAFDVSEYAVSAFQWATGAGIVQGADGNLMPKASCTRAQIVTMLYRLLGE